MIEDTCEVGACENPSMLAYYNWAVCEYHWGLHCGPGTFNLKEEFGIKDRRQPRQLAGAAAAWLQTRKRG